MQIILEGNLEYFDIVGILKFLGSSAKKGSLKLVADGREAELFVDGSSVIQAHVAGKWSESSEQAVDAMAEMLGWRKGTFAFLDSAAHAGKSALSLDVDQLLVDGKRRMEERGRGGARQPDMSVIFRPVDQPENSEVEMSGKEWKFLSRFDGARTLGEVLDKQGESREESLALVQRMFENNLIAPVTRDAAAGTPAPAATVGELVSHQPRPPKTKEPKPADSEAKPPGKEVPPGGQPAAADKKDSRAEKKDVRAERKEAAAEKPAEVPVSQPAEPSGPIMACLTMDDGDKEMFPLLDDSYTVGRDANNAIVVADSSVSSMHAKVVRTPEGFVIEDLKSRNGTHVNDEKVERKLLADNDSIRLGRIYLTYNIASEMKASRATMYEVKRPD